MARVSSDSVMLHACLSYIHLYKNPLVRSYADVYGPSKPSSLPSTTVWLKSTASLVGLGEKLRWVPRTTYPC
jgi:hypothetical protein